MSDGCNVVPWKKLESEKKEKRKERKTIPFTKRWTANFFYLRQGFSTEPSSIRFHDGSNFNVGVNVINAYQLPPPPPPPPLFIRCIDRAQPSGAIRIRGSINIMSINQRHPATWKRSFVSPGLREKKHPSETGPR